MEIPAGRATQVLQLLAPDRGRLVAADRIVEAPWAEPQRAVYQSVASLVSRLRPAIVREAIEGDRRGYRLTRSASTDLEEIGDLVARAAAHQRSGSPARVATPVQRALALLDRGPLIPGNPDATRADSARRMLERTRRQAPEIGWRAAAQLGDHRLADMAAMAGAWSGRAFGGHLPAPGPGPSWRARGPTGRIGARRTGAHRCVAGAAERGRATAGTSRAHPPARRAAHGVGNDATTRSSPGSDSGGSGAASRTSSTPRPATPHSAAGSSCAHRRAGTERSVSMHPLAEVVADHLNQLCVDLQEELTSGVDLSDLVGNVDTTVAVGSFEPAATAELAAAAGMPDLAPAIQEATGGDPLFAVEALCLANEARPAAAVQALAGSVRDIVLDGIHRGGPGVESFLRLAATFGVVFDLDDVAVLGSRSPEELAHHADRALAAGLISVRATALRSPAAWCATSCTPRHHLPSV